MQRVGEAQLKVWIWSLYRAQLLSPDGNYQPDRYPLLLSLSYQRDFASKQLLDATEQEWQRLAVCHDSPCQSWLIQLDELWPDIKKGDNLSLYAPTADSGHFYLNGRHLGSLHGDKFGEKFLAIWLSPNSRFEDQRLNLIGRQ
jgi:hypothetical protein